MHASDDPRQSASASTSDVISTPAPAETPLSKNQRKKLAKREAFLAARPAKRAAEKARKKQRAAEEREKRKLAGDTEDDEGEPARKKRKKSGGVDEAGKKFGATLVVDCGFDELMTDKEISSMQQQLAQLYSINRYASPCFKQIFISSLKGKLKARCEAVYKNGDLRKWKGVRVDERSWQDLLLAPPLSSSTDATQMTSVDAPPEGSALSSSSSVVDLSSIEVPDKSSIVYLTADSPNTLETLSSNHTYVLGGLVDRNRHKEICLSRAQSAGVSHARLPISEHLKEMKSRKVLTVNQVGAILVEWLRERDWGKALEKVIPIRKMRENKDQSRTHVGVEGHDEHEDDMFGLGEEDNPL